jgi:hypothetical protein
MCNSPRALGVDEHLKRIELLHRLAASQPLPDSYRLLISALTSCQAIVTIMLEAAMMDEVPAVVASPEAKWQTFKEEIRPWFPYFDLIEAVRIHDFHRFGIVPPDPNRIEFRFQGPMKLTARSGVASVVFTSAGRTPTTSGNSTVKGQRPLTINDGAFFDEASGSYVRPEAIINAFLSQAPAAIAKFKAHLKCSCGSPPSEPKS